MDIMENKPPIEEHKLQLAQELVYDIEQSRLPPEQILMKASRLAQLVRDEESNVWLDFETKGYDDSPLSYRYSAQFKRWVGKEIRYKLPLANLLDEEKLLRDLIRPQGATNVNVTVINPIFSENIGDDAINALDINSRINSDRINKYRDNISQISQIRVSVIEEVRRFANRVFYQLVFKDVIESLFARYQTEIESSLSKYSKDVLDSMPDITAMLMAGNPSAISGALNGCRKLIKAFADAIQPADGKVIEENGEKYMIGSDQYLNRINYFIKNKCPSKSRVKRLDRNLRAINDRASAGTHGDVTIDEAKALFLQTYLTLGEIIIACLTHPKDVDTSTSPL